jgi:hypothetical protein
MATARVQLGCVCSDDRLAPECRLLALSDVSLALDGMSAIGATTDIGQTWGEDASVANDPYATS